MAAVATPLNELDVMLQDLSAGHYATSNVTSHITSNNSNAADYSVYSDFGSFTNVPTRPPQPNLKSHHKGPNHLLL